MKKIFLGLMACAALCACTSDDLVSNVNEAQKTFEGNTAYMTVCINDVGTGTRATSSGYQNGSAEEYAVNDAYFYFYDAAGVYVSQASVWNGGSAVTGNTNIEFKSNTVIVLEGLTGRNYPNYVVTVLNKPAGFTPGETLDEMADLLADATAVGIMQGTDTYFTMSTSSYVDGTSDTRLAYFATPLTEDDFYTEPVSTTIENPVQIYVERLAAKVQLLVGEGLTPTDLTDGSIGYKMTETIGGDPNNEGDVNDGGTDIYVKLTGWALNGTAKHSNIVKNIVGLDVTNGVDGWTGWNDAEEFRSFWGKSFNYGLGKYPETSGGETDGTTLDDYLDYVSYNDLQNKLGSDYCEYCAENTNTVDILGTKNSSGITNVLLAAEVCDIEGNPLDLVRYEGELFEKGDYLNYVMSELTATGALNVYTLDSSSGVDVYTHIDGSYIELASSDDGYVIVALVENAFASGTYYMNNGDGTFTEISDPTSDVETQLATFNTAHPKVNAFTGGQMYYHIPIQHLNNDYTGDLLEANYGIVRNHWYVLTITSLENLGKGVYDPDEVIIPNTEDDVQYYVGANINILSWKMVEQSVTLK